MEPKPKPEHFNGPTQPPIACVLEFAVVNLGTLSVFAVVSLGTSAWLPEYITWIAKPNRQWPALHELLSARFPKPRYLSLGTWSA